MGSGVTALSYTLTSARTPSIFPGTTSRPLQGSWVLTSRGPLVISRVIKALSWVISLPI